MPRLPLRPLVPLSALALLGWCWYTFRKKTSLCQRAEEESSVSSTAKNQSTVENVEEKDASASEGTLEAQDVEILCHFQSHQQTDFEANLDRNCFQPSSAMDDPSVLSGASLATIVTSTPLKGIRPEPEGEVSKARASLLLAEKPETETDQKDDEVKGHSDVNAIKLETFAQQPTGNACPKEHGATNVSEKQTVKTQSLGEADGLVVEIMGGAHEITAIGGVLTREGPAELVVIPQVSNILMDAKKDFGPLRETVEESVSSAHKPIDRPSEEDSGCSTCHSDDGREALTINSKAVEETSSAVSVASQPHQAMAPEHETLSRQKVDACKDFANGVRCAYGESRVTTDRAVQSRNSPHTRWRIEVPSHLVGRLIGKKGKHISSLKQNSGAKIYVSTLPYMYEFQICHVEGSEVQVEKALVLIRKKFKDLDLSNRPSSLQPAEVPSLPITSWLPLPQDGTVEVIVPCVEAANYLFVQQHAHPTYYGLCSLTEQMLFCYSHPGCPSLPTPVKAGVLCAAPSPDGAWWRAQVIQHYKDFDTVQIRYVDYGGYVTVDLTSLKQIRSDFVTLPFQASEVMLENIAPLPDEGTFSFEAKAAVEELTQGIPLIMKVTSSQNGLPLVHMWRHNGEEMISVNGVLVDRGLCSWLDSH